MDMISVIVPVYNIEKYIERCVKSIINQTYKNLQIILVDDGSTDSSGEICETIKMQDDRIEVIHKKNGGASDARNCGVEKVRGEYIAFVDGDDYIDEDMYEILYNLMQLHNGDIVSCGIYEEFQDKNNILCYNANTRELNRMEAYEALFKCELGISCCNKLFRKKILDNIEYETGIVYGEDMKLIDRAIRCSETVVCANVIKYHYCHRVGSATTKAFSKKSMDILFTLDAMIDFINQNYPSISLQAYAYQAQWLLNHYQWLYKDRRLNEFKEEKRFMEKRISDNLKWYLGNKHIYWCNTYLLCSIVLHVFSQASWLLETGVKIKGKLTVKRK